MNSVSGKRFPLFTPCSFPVPIGLQDLAFLAKAFSDAELSPKGFD